MRTAAIDTAHKSAVRVALATGFLLLIPFLAMQFTEEVEWDLADFTVAGVLLFGAGLTYELAVRKAAGNIAYRAAIGIAVLAALSLIWVNLAVGLIGAEDNPANLMYCGVLVVGIVGAIFSRLQPRGMALTLISMALAQALVAVIALIFGLGHPTSEPLEILFLNGFFIFLFSASAWLFWRATHRGSAVNEEKERA